MPRLDFESKHDCTELRVSNFRNLLETDILRIVVLGNLHSVDLVTKALSVLAEPLTFNNVSVNFPCGGNEVGNHCDEPRRKAGLSQKVHLDLFHDN